MQFMRILVTAALALTAAAVTEDAFGVTLQVDQAKQRYPWNGLVDIDYTVTTNGTEKLGADDCLEVYMIDNALTPAETNRAVYFLQTPLPITHGKHRITWDAHHDGVSNCTDKAQFLVKIAHYNESYMVVDVSAGRATNAIYPVDFLNGQPAGGFNTPEYKGNKIVFRRIHAGSYQAGSPTDEANRSTATGDETLHSVILSKAYYFTIFEVTAQQWYQIGGDMGVPATGNEYLPATDRSDKLSSKLPGFAGKCRMKDDDGNYTVPLTGVIDLPTEFQWEYACRSGTAFAFNTTNAFDNTSNIAQTNQLAQLGRFKGNTGDGKGNPEATTVTVVGSYLPNAWGIYDMHGNRNELCRGFYTANVAGLKQVVDPVGPSQGSPDYRLRVVRGGSYADDGKTCRSAARSASYVNGQNGHGIRIVREVP